MRMNTTRMVLASVAMLGLAEARAQTAIPPSPQDFVQAAAQSDNYEIMAAHPWETPVVEMNEVTLLVR